MGMGELNPFLPPTPPLCKAPNPDQNHRAEGVQEQGGLVEAKLCHLRSGPSYMTASTNTKSSQLRGVFATRSPVQG